MFLGFTFVTGEHERNEEDTLLVLRAHVRSFKEHNLSVNEYIHISTLANNSQRFNTRDVTHMTYTN